LKKTTGEKAIEKTTKTDEYEKKETLGSKLSLFLSLLGDELEPEKKKLQIRYSDLLSPP